MDDRITPLAAAVLLSALCAVSPLPPSSPAAAHRVSAFAGTPEPAPPPEDGAPDAGVTPPPGAEITPPLGAGVTAPGARYAWPLLPIPVVVRPFLGPAHDYGPGHRGVDLLGAVGQAVLAARGGTVVFAGPVGGRPVVSVQHDDGLRTTYEPVDPLVTAGAVVRAGAVLGVLLPGHAGCPSTGASACLHWGVRRDRGSGPAEYLDPLVLLRPTRVRLLPEPDPWPPLR